MKNQTPWCDPQRSKFIGTGCRNVVFVRDKDYLREKAAKFYHIRKERLWVVDGEVTEIIAGLMPGEVIASKNSVVLEARPPKSNLGRGLCGCMRPLKQANRNRSRLVLNPGNRLFLATPTLGYCRSRGNGGCRVRVTALPGRRRLSRYDASPGANQQGGSGPRSRRSSNNALRFRLPRWPSGDCLTWRTWRSVLQVRLLSSRGHVRGQAPTFILPDS